MKKENITINVVGEILEGDNKGWFVLIQEDFENTGGYLILVSSDSKFSSNDGMDYWVEEYRHIMAFLMNRIGK